jgi:hypothetical protein
MTMRPDPTFHPSPKLAMEAPPENFAYTLLLSPDFSRPDALAVIDVKPGSATFSQVVHTVTMPHKGGISALLKHSPERLHLIEHLCGGPTANESIGMTESVPEIVNFLSLLTDECCGTRRRLSVLDSQSFSCSGESGIRINPARSCLGRLHLYREADAVIRPPLDRRSLHRSLLVSPLPSHALRTP